MNTVSEQSFEKALDRIRELSKENAALKRLLVQSRMQGEMDLRTFEEFHEAVDALLTAEESE